MFSLFFLARLTFLCGLFFAASWALLFFEHGLNPELTSWMLTIGFGMGAILIPFFNLACLIQRVRGKLHQNPTPRWLIIANFIWLLLFITFILYLNGSHTHQP